MDNEPDYRPPRQRLISWIAGLVSLAIVAIIFLPKCNHSRDTERKMLVQNRLKHIVLGVQNYGNTYGGAIMPAGGTFREDGTPLHGWQTFITPFLQSDSWYDHLDLSVPWDDPVQVDRFKQTKWSIYLDPDISQTVTVDGLPVMHFAANEWLLHRGSHLHMSHIIDFQHTMLVGDAFGDFRPMGEPFQWRDPTVAFQTSPRQFGHISRKSTRVAYLDASVEAINADIDAEVFARLAGAPELRPAPELVARPTVPYRLATRPRTK